jgi:uncharacterized protein
MDELTLQRLRESSGLRLDAEGRFWHQGGLVEHQRTLEVLHRGLHRAPDGRWATRIGSEWGYVEVEDAARFVRRVEEDPAAPGSLRAWLLTGEELHVPASAVSLGARDALYLRLRDGERALLFRPAQLSLAPHLHERRGGGFELELSGRRFEIGVDRGAEPVRRS